MNLIVLKLLPWSQIVPTSGLVVALSLIRSLVFLLLVLGSGGVRLILFALRVTFSPVEVSVLFPGLFSLSKELRCGGSHFGFAVFWCCSPGVLKKPNVVRHVGRLLDGHHGSVPFELVKDGDLLLLIGRMLRLRGLDTVRVTKVKGHADKGMVLNGRVCEIDRFGNNAADEAADFGRRRSGNAVIDARRNLSWVCGRWYPVILDPQRFFIAISRAVVNHDGGNGTAPDPLVWSAGALTKRRKLVHAVRDRAFLPGPPGIWDSEWVYVPATAICAEDITHWPFF